MPCFYIIKEKRVFLSKRAWDRSCIYTPCHIGHFNSAYPDGIEIFRNACKGFTRENLDFILTINPFIESSGQLFILISQRITHCRRNNQPYILFFRRHSSEVKKIKLQKIRQERKNREREETFFLIITYSL